MGLDEWRFVCDRHDIPAAVSGFEPRSLLASIYAVLRQKIEGRAVLENCYDAVVREGGNPTAQRLLSESFDIIDANWRGIGTIPQSGYALKSEFGAADAIRRFDVDMSEQRKRAGEMPPGCDCARVVLGKIYPNQCTLYGKACTPRRPIGPCMVSDEGACRIWWSSGVREGADHEPAPAGG